MALAHTVLYLLILVVPVSGWIMVSASPLDTKRRSVDMVIDAGDPAANSLRATVNVDSVSTGNGQIDSTLRGGNWFDVANHPEATFTSAQVRVVDVDRVEVSGSLRIKDIAGDMAFPMTLTTTESQRMARGGFTLDRLDFNLGRSSQPDEETVAFQVRVNFEFEVRELP